MGPDGTFISPLRADQSGEEIAKALARLLG
jgi:hypothetical protein